MPACSCCTLTNVLPHRKVMPQTQGMTPHPVTVYRHGTDLLLCYPLMWKVTLEYTITHFTVLGKTQSGNPSPTFHTHQRTIMFFLHAGGLPLLQSLGRIKLSLRHAMLSTMYPNDICIVTSWLLIYINQSQSKGNKSLI